MRTSLLLLLASLCATLACSDTTDVGGVRDISQDEFVAAPPPDALILDVRTPEEFASGHVPRAVNIPHTELAGRLDELPSGRTTPIVVYCEKGGRAGMAATALLDAGFTEILHLDGDMSAWRTSGQPVQIPDQP
jgi:phage shock protein E